MKNVVNFKKSTRSKPTDKETIKLLVHSIEIEARAYWRYLANVNKLLGYNDIPAEMQKNLTSDELGELMETTYERIRWLKENAYEYHVAMCRKEAQND